MKTSYYAKYKESDGISIAGKCPHWYIGEEFKTLAPKLWFFQEYKKNGDIYFYTYHFQTSVLNLLDPIKIYDQLKDRVLLCYEKSGEFCHRRLVANWLTSFNNVKIPEIIDSNHLECSSIGDKRFSAFYAKVKFNNEYKSIEEFYQGAKRFNNQQLPLKEAKGKTPTSVRIKDDIYPVEILSNFYQYLWCLYFIQNIHYLDYINHFEIFTDKFKGNSKNCQADVIREIVEKGLPNLLSNNIDLIIKYGL